MPEKQVSSARKSNSWFRRSQHPASSSSGGALCTTCTALRLSDFISPHEFTDPLALQSRPECTALHLPLSQVALNSTGCDLCELIAHAVHAGLALAQGKPLPVPTPGTSIDTLEQFFPHKPLTPASFKSTHVWVRRSAHSLATDMPKKLLRPRSSRIAYQLEIHLVEESWVSATNKRKRGSAVGVGSLQLMMDAEKENEEFPAFSSKTFYLGRKVPEMVRIPQIKRWISICHEKHKDCQRTETNFGPLPTKLKVIDVQEWMIADLPENAPYVALSYCWGRDQKYKLLEGNIEAWSKPGGMVGKKELPDTISDSITLVEQLGMRYLWVDALCIVQDSNEVKMHQIGQMDRVYASSSFTIIAADGMNCDAGLPGVNIPRKNHQLIKTVQNLRVAVKLPELGTSMKFATWNTRGWTYQELLLCSSALFFTPHQLYFECYSNEIYFEDSYADNFPHAGDRPFQNNVLGTTRSSFRMHMTDSLWGEEKPEDMNAEPYMRSLGNFIKDYTTRSLTNASDIYHAMQGIFNRLDILQPLWFRGLIGGLPIAGLDKALLWIPLTPPKHRETDDMNLPSWTWASHDGPVDMLWTEYDYRFPPIVSDVKAHTAKDTHLISDALIDGYKCSSFVKGLHKETLVKQLRNFGREYSTITPELKPEIDELKKKTPQLMLATQLEFTAESGTFVLGPEIVTSEGSQYYNGIFNRHINEHYIVCRIFNRTDDSLQIGTLRVPREKHVVGKEVELVAVCKHYLPNGFVSDQTVMKNNAGWTEPVEGLGVVRLVLAVEEGRRWAVGAVLEEGWNMSEEGRKRGKVVLV